MVSPMCNIRLLALRADLRPHSLKRWIWLDESPCLAAFFTLKPSLHEATYPAKSFYHRDFSKQITTLNFYIKLVKFRESIETTWHSVLTTNAACHCKDPSPIFHSGMTPVSFTNN